MDEHATSGILAFVGVTASASSINDVFPRWARVLDLGPVHLEPIDLPLDSPEDTYRGVVDRLRREPAYRGALITSHKVRLLRAARDLFDGFDSYAEVCGEVSCIAKHDGRVTGHAKDPITSGRALDDLLAPDHFRSTGGRVVCLGAGGSGLAIAVYLLAGRDPRDRPERITLVDTDAARLTECNEILAVVGAAQRTDSGGRHAVETVTSAGSADNDAVVAAAPPGSLIVNATGMGKDRPGSPLTDAVAFPRGAVVWELNYRGDRPFLQQAQAQAPGAELTVEDGWRYFIHGWSEVIAEVFEITLTPRILDALGRDAERIRE